MWLADIWVNNLRHISALYWSECVVVEMMMIKYFMSVILVLFFFTSVDEFIDVLTSLQLILSNVPLVRSGKLWFFKSMV